MTAESRLIQLTKVLSHPSSPSAADYVTHDPSLKRNERAETWTEAIRTHTLHLCQEPAESIEEETLLDEENRKAHEDNDDEGDGNARRSVSIYSKEWTCGQKVIR